MAPFFNKGQTCAFFQSAGSCPVCNVFSYKRLIIGAISVFNCFKTTGFMESGPAALSGSRLDNRFSIPLRSILISGIVEHGGGGGYIFRNILLKEIMYLLGTQLT